MFLCTVAYYGRGIIHLLHDSKEECRSVCCGELSDGDTLIDHLEH